MKKLLKISAIVLVFALLLALAVGTWYVRTKLPVRQGSMELKGLQGAVSVQYDERGVPHIRATSQLDAYRALGYVHAQDRLFQMEMVRRLAKGELAAVLGPKLLESDKLFRALRIREKAQADAAALDPAAPATAALLAYLDGINQYQASRPAPMELELLGIPRTPFTPEDTFAVGGYLAYSFAAALRTEPVMTTIRDQLGSDYLRIFDMDWHPQGALHTTAAPALNTATWHSLQQVAAASLDASTAAALPLQEGSNGWAIAGSRTASGKPLLAGDPHVMFAAPAVWYEAHLSAPDLELYGHYQVLNPFAALGHNARFGWTLTMFQNDDMDLVAEKPNPANAQQLWHQGQWVDMTSRTETIAVKGQAPVQLQLRSGPHGPIINDAFPTLGASPIALWWTHLQADNTGLQAFYELNHADTLDKARSAAAKMVSPGVNVLWVNEAGDIAWWAAARLPQRPAGVNPAFILDASQGQADKPGFYAFGFNPHEENPARGYVVSGNQQPANAVPVPGYYSLADRARRLDATLQALPRWDTATAQALQLDNGSDYYRRILGPVLPVLKDAVTDPTEHAYLEPLVKWDGTYTRDSIAATFFTQFLYEIAHAAMADELGEAGLDSLRQTRGLDDALALLVADAASPWWDSRDTPAKETRAIILQQAWHATCQHLQTTLGKSLTDWSWGKAHTLTHPHPLGQQKPMDWLFNVGPFPIAGGREVPNNLSTPISPAPWAVRSGPSTRRVIDFGQAGASVGINPMGQSGVLFDKHYADQATRYAEGMYAPQYLSEADVNAHTVSVLHFLLPKR